MVCRRGPDRTVGPIWNAPERSGPVAGLSQQVLPCDGGVVFAGEQAGEWRVVLRVVADIVNQAALPRQTGERREEGLCHAVRHIHAVRLAPLRYDVAVADDEAGHAAARLGRTEEFPPGLLCAKSFFQFHG